MEALFPNSTAKFLVTDGGTGTTLEQYYATTLHSSLWSSKLLLSNPNILQQLHQGWENVGANIISTATYQATLDQVHSTLKSSNPNKESNREESKRCMRSAVDLVRNSITKKGETRTSLSLGPYGAILTPSEDYTGNYHFNQLDQEEEDYLMEFHYDRLRIFRSEDADTHGGDETETWDKIDLVQFETIPKLSEVRAIRRAWKNLHVEQRNTSTSTSSTVTGGTEHGKKSKTKPWVISLVFPGPKGEFPTRESPTSVLETVLKQDDLGRYSKPDGIGINCTKLKHLQHILSEWSKIDPSIIDTSQTWLWLYPDGGPSYDPVTRTWSNDNDQTLVLLPNAWAKMLVDTASQFASKWKGIVLGGCCNAGPAHIHELSKLAHSSKSK